MAMPTRLSISGLEPCVDGLSVFCHCNDTASDTEKHARHLTGIAGRQWKAHARLISKIPNAGVSGQFVSAIPSLIPSGSFERGARYHHSRNAALRSSCSKALAMRAISACLEPAS
ncbi:protein of unknown function [Paraburkholderia kururiensis]